MAPSDSRMVLAVGAHPGSLELFCAGTLALLRKRGWRVVLATITPGDSGSSARSREKSARQRLEEARRSAAVIEAEYHCLESAGFTIFFSDAPCQHAAGLVRLTQPDLVLTHSAVDSLADHEETSRIVRQACVSAPVPTYETGDIAGGEAPTARVPHLYYCDPVEGKDFLGRPVTTVLIVDVSAVIDTKEQMAAQHVSQREWPRQPAGGKEYLDQMRTWSQKRGQQAGCAYGESFRQHQEAAYPDDDLLRDVLGSLVHAKP